MRIPLVSRTANVVHGLRSRQGVALLETEGNGVAFICPVRRVDRIPVVVGATMDPVQGKDSVCLAAHVVRAVGVWKPVRSIIGTSPRVRVSLE